MWVVYDEYEDHGEREFHSVQEAGDWIESSDDPVAYRIRYTD